MGDPAHGVRHRNDLTVHGADIRDRDQSPTRSVSPIIRQRRSWDRWTPSSGSSPAGSSRAGSSREGSTKTTPAGVDVIGALTLDDLRKVFSGYRRHCPAEQINTSCRFHLLWPTR
jgi:hypothetical protein